MRIVVGGVSLLAKEDGADRVPHTNILRGLLATPGRPMSKKCRDLFLRRSAFPIYLISNNSHITSG
jgi:hypothetical protein